MKKILIINGHPREKSFCLSLAQQYKEGAESTKNDILFINLKDLRIEPWLKYKWEANHDSIPMSDDLLKAQEYISLSDHIVFIFPTYWSAPPALLKLFLEVVMISNFAFKYRKSKKVISVKIPVWNKLLKGKTASIISTMDTYPLVMKLILHDPVGKMMRAALEFTGIKLKHKYYFGSVKLSSEEQKKKWLMEVYKIGKIDCNY